MNAKHWIPETINVSLNFNSTQIATVESDMQRLIIYSCWALVAWTYVFSSRHFSSKGLQLNLFHRETSMATFVAYLCDLSYHICVMNFAFILLIPIFVPFCTDLIFWEPNSLCMMLSHLMLGLWSREVTPLLELVQNKYLPRFLLETTL